ncbi:hypothetical protein D3C71_1859660 [compost metagenome]
MVELRLDPQITVAVGGQVGCCRRQMPLRNAAGAFTGVRRERSDINQAHDIRLIARLCYHRTAIGMPHQQHGAGHLRDHFTGAFSVIGQ